MSQAGFSAIEQTLRYRVVVLEIRPIQAQVKAKSVGRLDQGDLGAVGGDLFEQRV